MDIYIIYYLGQGILAHGALLNHGPSPAGLRAHKLATTRQKYARPGPPHQLIDHIHAQAQTIKDPIVRRKTYT
jgi:hypothetical protein